jgi:hypothetical protein
MLRDLADFFRRKTVLVILLVCIAFLGLNGCATDYEDFNPDPVPPVNPESAPHESTGDLPTGPSTPPPPNPFNQPVNPYGH